MLKVNRKFQGSKKNIFFPPRLLCKVGDRCLAYVAGVVEEDAIVAFKTFGQPRGCEGYGSGR